MCVREGERESTNKSGSRHETTSRAQELCERRGGRPGSPVPESPCGLCGRKATLKAEEETSCLSLDREWNVPLCMEARCLAWPASVDPRYSTRLQLEKAAHASKAALIVPQRDSVDYSYRVPLM